jgi:hypothetical protein
MTYNQATKKVTVHSNSLSLITHPHSLTHSPSLTHTANRHTQRIHLLSFDAMRCPFWLFLLPRVSTVRDKVNAYSPDSMQNAPPTEGTHSRFVSWQVNLPAERYDT